MEEGLNINDEKLLAYCYDKKRHLSDIARHLKIERSNISARIPKLEKKGLIKTFKIQNKVFVRTISGDKTEDYIYEMLKTIKENGGKIREEDLLKLIDYSFGEKGFQDKFNAPLNLLFSGLVDKYVHLNLASLKFLKDYKLKKEKEQNL